MALADNGVGVVEVALDLVGTGVKDTLPGAGVSAVVKVEGLVHQAQETRLGHADAGGIGHAVGAGDADGDRGQQAGERVTRVVGREGVARAGVVVAVDEGEAEDRLGYASDGCGGGGRGAG